MTWYWYAALGIAAFIILLLVLGTELLFKFAVVRDDPKKKKETDADLEENAEDDVFHVVSSLAPYRKELREAREKLRGTEYTGYTVTSYDGIELKARLYRPEGDMRAIVLLMHGYRSNPTHDFACAVDSFFARGIGCFMPCQRAHAASGGKYITYGVRERYDVLEWAKLIEREFPGMPVILDGVSMGASSVLMASELELPSSVKGIIADCGFTSPGDIFSHVLKADFGMPKLPFFHLAKIPAKLRAGFSFDEASTKNALMKNTLPVLFIHGDKDQFVPYEMSAVNYGIAKEHCDASLLTVKGAMHGIAFLVDKESYLRETDKLIAKCIGKSF